MKTIYTLFLYIFIISISTANDATIIKSIESYKSKLDGVQVFEEKSLDLNRDKNTDYLMYSSGGEEVYLDLLLSNDSHYYLINIPTGEEYTLIKNNGFFEVKVKIGTSPTFGSLQGPDKYYWYDFYKIEKTKISKSNKNHVEFYKNIIKNYKERILELKNEIKSLKKSSPNNEYSLPEKRWKNETIEKYKNFIEKANEVINEKT